ncbi:MAG: ATP-binding protein [Burkholderiaceae bacterium]
MTLSRLSNLPGRLLLIVSAAILPIALVCAFALHGLLKGQAAQTQASALGVARAVATAVDSELGRTIATLNVLALAEPFATPDEAGMTQARALAAAVHASHPEWRGLLLSTPSGAVVFSTGVANTSIDTVVEKGSHDQVLRDARPAVGALSRGPGGNLAFPVRVPIMKGGEVRYVLTAIVRPEAIARVLQRQIAPEGWVVSVLDPRHLRIARNVDDDRLRGLAPSESLQALLNTMGDRREMLGATTTVEGARVQAVLSRIDSAPWIISLGATLSTAEDARREALAAYGGGLLGSLALGLLAAWWLSRAITTPMARLRRNAQALGEGAPLAPSLSGIPEIDAVDDALAGAAATRLRNQSEREQLLASEQAARDLAQAASRRLEWLVSVSAVLSRSLEEDSTLSAIAQVVVPEVADLCRIDLLDDEGQLQRKLTHHVDPEKNASIARMVSTRVAPSDAPGSFPWAIATGEMFLHNIDDPAMPEIDPGLREFARMLGITAACVVPLRARGRTIGAMAVLQADSRRRFSPDDGILIGEIAQRAALALDNVQLLARARSAQWQAESANRAKDEFLAMLGHELRNPLAPIALALQLISRRNDSAFPQERLIIERQVRHLSRMVDDLLDVSRIVSGKINLTSETLDLREVAANAVEQTLPAMQHRKAELECVLPDAPVTVYGDRLRLAQIVSNLLNNAAKFTDADRRILLRLTTREGDAELRVVDEGAGISAALLPHVFERFVQGTQELQRASGGLGLGLAIAQSLARLHGGVIEASSAGEGKGSTFMLRLPLQHAARAVPLPATPRAPARARLKLLLVDDNLDALKMLGEWCTLEGHEVTSAASAEDALGVLAEAGFDAGVFDIGLPGMNGYELARRVRASPRGSAMVLVALTGYGQEKDKARALEAGFDDHFPKPAEIDRVLERIEEMSRDRKAVPN